MGKGDSIHSSGSPSSAGLVPCRNRGGRASSERPCTMPAVPVFVYENGAMGKRILATGAVSVFGCARH